MTILLVFDKINKDLNFSKGVKMYKTRKISKTFYNRYFELNAINRLGNELFRFMNFKEGKFINPMKKDEYIKQYVEEEIQNFYEKHELNIPQIEFCLTTQCSLKCKDCCALMPSFNQKGHIKMSVDEFKKSLDQILDAVNSIRKLIILGGEPSLRAELPELLEYAAKKEKVIHIAIVSNGTMMPNHKLIEILKKYNKINFYMSNYMGNPDIEPILKYDKIKELLKQNGVKYQMMESWEWFKELGFAKEKISEKAGKHNYETCHRTKCMQTLDRKIDICSKAFSGRNLGLIETKDYIDLDKTKNLKQELIDFYQKDMVDACEYCLLSTQKVSPALQLDESEPQCKI